MPLSLPLLRGSITLEDALDDDNDVLHQLSYPQKRLDFYLYLDKHRKDIEELVAFHLSISATHCTAAKDFREWVHGSFNACVPIYIDSTKYPTKKVFIRFPLSYKVGDVPYPGNAEEKLRCEVATYIWIKGNCADVPIPCLRGFGFANGRSFTAPQNTPFIERTFWFFRRQLLWLFGYPSPSEFIPRNPPHTLNAGYLIVDCVDTGDMLSATWESLRHDEEHRKNLFKSLSRIMLSLARVPQPRIGSFTINDQGVLSLTNRPLTCSLHQLENLSIPTDIPRGMTYNSTDTYLSDLLTCHDNRIRYMPNSIHDLSDGELQLSALVMMRSLLQHFTDRNLRHSPFALMLTDLHQSNIFVDKDWNVTSIIDLEWACSLPIEMQHPPYWLTSTSIDRLVEEELEAFTNIHSEFMRVFEQEERLSVKHDTPHSQIMQRGWEIGNFWYFSALDCLNGLHHLYFSHIQRKFALLEDSGPDFDHAVSMYWAADVPGFISGKLEDKQLYCNQLRELFGDEPDALDDNADDSISGGRDDSVASGSGNGKLSK